MEKEIVELYGRFAGPTGPKYSPPEIRDLAVSSARKAFEILSGSGNELDAYAYRTFVAGVGRAVAEAAREGDVMGVGGRLVSDPEREVIDAVVAAPTPSARQTIRGH